MKPPAQPPAYGDKESDRALVARAQDGDRAAWLALYRRYVGELFGFCYNELGDAQDAEDVVAEAFLKAVRGLARFDGRSSFRTWLYSITRNQLRDRWRRAGRRPRTVALAEARDATQIDSEPMADASDSAVSPRATMLGRAVLQALPDRYALVLRLRIMEGRSIKDTAEAMGTTAGNVKVLQHRALKRARTVAARWEAGSFETGTNCAPQRTLPAGGAR
jgi:RNA polymerase sigma-70 factor (ECF subfamily)